MTKWLSISINILPIPESEWSLWDFIAIFSMGSAIPSDSLVSITLLLFGQMINLKVIYFQIHIS